jgi:hypothetical protein
VQIRLIDLAAPERFEREFKLAPFPDTGIAQDMTRHHVRLALTMKQWSIGRRPHTING